ncbi:MAG: MFS transporter [Candidatus Coproplasma sp.]
MKIQGRKKEKTKEGRFTSLELKWILYDVGNSAFTLLAAIIIPIYFHSLAAAEGIDEASYQAIWAYVTSGITLVVAVLGPVLGTIADYEGFKKPFFFFAAIIGVIACAAMGIPMPMVVFLAVYVVAKITYSVSLVFYDSMLSDVTDMERVDKISSHGYAWGYIGSCVPFLLSIVIIMFTDLSASISMPIAFVLNAVWWLAFTLPLVKSYKQRHFVKREPKAVRSSFKRLFSVFTDKSPNHKGIILFLIAFFLYIDGVYTIIDMATTFGTALGLDQTQLLIALLVTQIVAFPCAIISGILAKKFENGKLIIAFIAGYTGIAVFAIFMQEMWQFWLLAVCVGLLQGGVQALSRSYFTKIIPLEKSGEYFGIMDVFGKGAAFVGTLLVGVVTQATGNINMGVVPISCLLALGLIVFIIAYIEIKRHKAPLSDIIINQALSEAAVTEDEKE